MASERVDSSHTYTLGSPKRKSRDKTVIAHISDLHFESDTKHDDAVWAALAADLAEQKVDFLAVTGDLIESSVRDNMRKQGIEGAFENVHRFLLSLCEHLKIDPEYGLGVVPGNHDFRAKGIASADSRFELVKRVKQRFVRPHFAPFYQKFGTYYRPKLLPSLNCCVFTFDSNTTDFGLNFASGRITNQDIVEFSSLSRKMEMEHRNEFGSCTKVVLVHHHPMPIAATELEPSFIESEGFHLLKNAGLFMTEMVRHGIDLVLHGHKHYPAISKATFPVKENAEHTITVIAAGSVGKGGGAQLSYNLVTLLDNGEVRLDRKTRETATYGRATWTAVLQSYEDTRRLRSEKMARLAGARLRADKYVKVLDIEARSGDVRVYEEYHGVRSYSGEEVDAADYESYFDTGSIRTPEFSSEQLKLRWEKSEESGRPGRVIFNPPIAQNPVDFEASNQVLNAIYFNQKDMVVFEGNVFSESVKTVITEVLDCFILKIHFPEDFIIQQPILEVYNEKGERDLTEERFSRSRLTMFGWDNTVIFSLEKPLFGYSYQITWDLPENEGEELNLKVVDVKYAEEITERLLKLREEDESAVGKVERALAELKEMINNGIGNTAVGAHDMEILIHAFDERQKGLVCVLGIATGKTREELCAPVIQVGETTVGQAYKRREQVGLLGVDQADFYDYADGHTGVLSIPLFFPFQRGARVGVITLATRSKTAAFLQLLEDDSSGERLSRLSALMAVVSYVLTWYSKTLFPALNLPEMPHGWTGEFDYDAD
jgi:3',5'-cyclic AMP phosphodiesterase CpdA